MFVIMLDVHCVPKDNEMTECLSKQKNEQNNERNFWSPAIGNFPQVLPTSALRPRKVSHSRRQKIMFIFVA